MRTRRERQMEIELDGLLDAMADETEHGGASMPASPELARLQQVALLVRTQGESGPGESAGHDIGESEPAGRPVDERRVPRLARVAAVVLLLTGVVAVAAVLRSGHGTQAPAGEPGRCLGPVRAVERDGAHLPASVLGNVLAQARGGGDPCPALPVLWVETTWARAGIASPSSPGQRPPQATVYAVEVRGTFFNDPYTQAGRPTHVSRFLESPDGGTVISGVPVPIARLGTVHELFLEPAPAQPRPPAWMLAQLRAAAGGPSRPTRVRWVETTLPELRQIAPRVPWAAAEYHGDGYRAWVTEVFGPMPGTRQPSFFDVFIDGSNLQSGALQQGVPATWQPVAALLRRSGTHTWWLAAPLPTSLPTWVARDVGYNLARDKGTPSVRWLVTTAGRLDRLAPYETAVPASLPAPVPVWIIDVTYSRSRSSSMLILARSPDDYSYLANAIPLPPGSHLSELGAFHKAPLADFVRSR